MYRDLLLDQLGVNFLGPAPLDLELLHMLTTFHWNALGSTLGWWFCHNNTVSCNEKFWVEQVTVPHPPLGKDKGWGTTRGGVLHKNQVEKTQVLAVIPGCDTGVALTPMVAPLFQDGSTTNDGVRRTGDRNAPAWVCAMGQRVGRGWITRNSAADARPLCATTPLS